MRILYVTDLHGDQRGYERALAVAHSTGVDAVVNGGDLLPKRDLASQHRFITSFLGRHFSEYERAGLPLLCMPGNDDLRAFDNLLDETCERHGVHNIARSRVELGSYDFIGFDLVADYPFGLKDRCRMDDEDFQFPPQISTPVVSDGSWPEFRGLRPLMDWFGYAETLPTLAQELERLPRPRDPDRAVYVVHMPPSGLGLDVCSDGRRVGSMAVKRFLERIRPRLSFHGHIHESPRMSGAWKADLGRTVVVQPGQSRGLTYVVAELGSMGVERVEE